jgi:hypothetical protein
MKEGSMKMSENNPTNVVAAFEMLLEEVEAEIDFVNRIGARAFERRDYEAAREALERAGQVTGFREKVVTLSKEWDKMAFVHAHKEDTDTHAQRCNIGRLRRGLRTREEAYWHPILEALASFGGAAPKGQVLERVRQSMTDVLREVDMVPLSSDPEMPRWRNAAQ